MCLRAPVGTQPMYPPLLTYSPSLSPNYPCLVAGLKIEPPPLMYHLGIDDRLKTTPIVESLVLPHPLYQGDRLSSPTLIGLCITHPSLNKALEFMSRLQVVKTLPKVFFPLRCGFEGAR